MDEQSYRLKIKIGQHEFEAEGPVEAVQKQFQAFKDLIASVPELTAPQYAIPVGTVPVSSTLEAPMPPMAQQRVESLNTDELKKIMQVDGRTVSLTVRPGGLYEAILLLLYGQKILRGNEMATGAEIVDGLTATGGLDFSRIDRPLEKLGRDGDVIVTGEHRGRSTGSPIVLHSIVRFSQSRCGYVLYPCGQRGEIIVFAFSSPCGRMALRWRPVLDSSNISHEVQHDNGG